MASRLDLEGCCFKIRCSNKGIRGILGAMGICFPTSYFDEGAPRSLRGLQRQLQALWQSFLRRLFFLMRYLLQGLSSESFLVSAHRPLHYKSDQFRTNVHG